MRTKFLRRQFPVLPRPDMYMVAARMHSEVLPHPTISLDFGEIISRNEWKHKRQSPKWRIAEHYISRLWLFRERFGKALKRGRVDKRKVLRMETLA